MPSNKFEVQFTDRAKQAVSDFILEVEGARPTGLRSASLYRQIGESIKHFERVYSDSEWFANNPVHSFEALVAGNKSERFPQAMLVLHFLRLRGGQYTVGACGELALPALYEMHRVIEEGKMVAKTLPDFTD